MSEFTTKQLKRHQAIGLVVAGIGAVMSLLTMSDGDKETFWTMYRVGFFATGIIVAVSGLILAGLAAAHQYTDFFDTSKRVDADKFTYQVIGIVVCAIFMIAALVSRIESTKPDQLPSEPDSRMVVKAQDRNFKLMVSFFIIASAAALAYFPARRFLKN